MLLRLARMGLVLGLLGAAGNAQEAQATGPWLSAPELPVAEWGRHGPLSLEDFRGQLTAVVFYDDQAPAWTAAARAIAELAEAKGFALVAIGHYDRPENFPTLSGRLWGRDALGGLDAKQATSRLLGGGSPVGMVLLGPEARVLWKGGDPAQGAAQASAELQQAIAPHLGKGLLGGLAIPTSAQPAARLLRSGQLAAAQPVLAALRGDAAGLKAELSARLERLRQEKRGLFDALRTADKSWDAFKVGTSYAKAFPKAPDAVEMREAVKKLQSAPAVVQNLAAKAAFASVAAAGYGSGSKAASPERTAAALARIAEGYPDTEYGRLASLLK